METILGILLAAFTWTLCLVINAVACYDALDMYQVENRRIGPNIYEARDTLGSQLFRIYTQKCSLLGGEGTTYLAWNGKSGVLEAYSPGTVKSCTVVRVEALGRP